MRRMRRIWRENILTLSNVLGVATLLILITISTVLSQQQPHQQANFDIVPGRLIYFDSGTSQTGDPGTFLENWKRSSSFVVSDHAHARHYSKGNLRRIHFRKRQFDNEKNARRQGQQCPGVCKYIPDRDFCPTNVIPLPEPEELEAYDYDEDYYSEEEYSEEEYYDEDDYEETEGDDYKNEVARRKKAKKGIRLTEPKRANETGQGKATFVGAGDNLHVVYPSITKFAVTNGFVNKRARKNDGDEKKQKVKMAGGKRRRRRRKPVVKERAPALEQEILIRWDHVFERGPFIGGDIVLPEGVLLRPPNFGFFRKQWPDGEIPFKMDPSLNTCRQNAILDAMDEIEAKTCIRFVERTTERNYIDIRLARIGCSSYVGMVGGAQHLNLSTGCFSKFTVTHELMHAIGFDHEQSRKDRDKFIDIDFENVLNEKEGQFELNPTFTGSGFPYDIRSIMHYSAFLFAKDKCEPTIYPVNDKIDICELGVGNGKGGMTDCDAAKVNKMYKCTGKKYPKKCKVKK